MTDHQIIDLYFQRSETAISATENTYGAYCRSIAIRILQNKEDAREVVNDTYWKVWNSIPPQCPNPLQSFLGKITRQLAINRLAQNTAQKRGGKTYALILEELTDCAGNTPADPTEEIALRDALNTFLRQLSDKPRQIFIQRYWYMLSVAEIANETGLGQSSVKMQLLRTREKLKIYLQEEGFLP